jgi:hypothetical protein
VDGQSVYLISDGGLSAVVSPLLDGVGQKAVSPTRILAYESVIEALHAERSVLPVRYATVLEERSAVIEMLHRHQEVFLSALRELDGCVEMAIRILADGGKDQNTLACSPPPLVRLAGRSPGEGFRSWSGADYLLARKRYYVQRDGIGVRGAELQEEFCRALSGLFIQCKKEDPLASSHLFCRPVASVDFLVKRENENAFRQAFRNLSQRRPEMILLSGPWPPYSFVPAHPAGG